MLALGQPSATLANGGHARFGTTEIPIVVLWIGGAVLGAFFLLFFIGWGVSYRARKRSQQGEMENNLQKANGEKK